MSQSHQRRTSFKGSPQASFYIDIEKSEDDDVLDQKEEQNYNRVIFLVIWAVVTIIIVGCGASVGRKLGNYHSSKHTADISNPIINVNGDANDEHALKLNEFFVDGKSVDSDIAALESEDLEKDTLASQHDLKEILLVSPIILISDDPDSSDQQQLEIIIKNLNIHPEPKIVSLDKHPHCKKILNYLKSYESHQDTTIPVTTTASSSEAIIKSDLKFTQEVLSSEGSLYEDLRYKTEKKLAESHALQNIPRLFIGGVPYGNFQELFKKYKDKSLAQFVREKGKGLITVG
ncbi:uncharacterized protein CANTADRAFT_25391 [Suhomyces tanzawaensis NRRL Y-17324]|uniref:Glutaredoxin domain-containing protein n=1 Tax=Suhomyces tanzawaensis NRRL Y-17324 TaxID=984487 RepID=A0A1E4SP54_9ASCO|nr:uncharacterized protein CANTADRAFT_25391 [Suhomyces tanzawaensis NRRL Y-17324]ODV81162.1 hypothetical protein CANTADRAFT_25391 [Suhomyces tanzawaensis NRRL Y-17324]